MAVESEVIGKGAGGDQIYRITLESTSGFKVQVITIGATISAICPLDRYGKRDNIVLAYPILEDYLANPAYIGSTVGRIAGRIRNGCFILSGRQIFLDSSCHPHALHSGPSGLHMVNWGIAKVSPISAELYCLDQPGAGKPPGQLSLTANFTIIENPAEEGLRVRYSAVTNATTYLNLANHSYFNLSGEGQTVLNHQLMVQAGQVAYLDRESIPLEDLVTVEKNGFNLQKPVFLSDFLSAGHSQLKQSAGLDHPFKLKHGRAEIRLFAPDKGRLLTVETNQEYAVIYSGNYLHEAEVPSGVTWPRHSGICFETQAIPNAPNRKDFSGKWLQKGQDYIHETLYRFSVAPTIPHE